MSPEEAVARLHLANTNGLLAWESQDQEASPSLPQLYKLAHLYRRSLGVFYLPTPPSSVGPLKRFRKPGGSEVEDYHEVLDRLLRRIELQRRWATRIHEGIEDPEPIQIFPGRLPANPDKSAATIRERLGIAFSDQVQWHDPYTGYRHWRDGIEQYGVLIFQNDPTSERIPLKFFRGMCLHDGPFPAILLNSSDAMNGRIFSLMHEYVHLLIETNGVQGRRLGSEALEFFCNEVAAATLIPTSAFLEDCTRFSISPDSPPSDDGLRKLSQRYCVSAEAILTRLVRSGKIAQDFYTDKVAELRKAYERAEAERKAKQKESEGGPKYSVMVLQRCGRRYSRMVRRAHEQRKLSLSQVSMCLGVRTDKIPKVFKELLGNAV